MNPAHIKQTLATTPAFIVNTNILLDNLALLNKLRQQSGCKVLYSIKALPLSTVLERVKEVVDGFSVSSLFEARLAHDILAGQGSIHLTTPGLNDKEWAALSPLLTHISFNSLSQYQRFNPLAPGSIAVGLRVNPKVSILEDARYDPSRPHSKLGVSIDELWQTAHLDTIKGLHLHNAHALTDFQPVLKSVEKLRQYFGKDLAKLDWLNLGGGYLFKDIKNHKPFIDLVQKLRADFNIEVYIEPGKAVVDDAGYLITTVIDTFMSDGKTLAILDTSVNHNPAVFEYQLQADLYEHNTQGVYSVVLAGNTCLAGDVFGEYRFNTPLAIGDRLIFTQMGAYSLIKAHRFNGYNLPDIYSLNGLQLTLLKHYTYQDYHQQWQVD